MASIPHAEMNDSQRRVKRVIDLATDTVVNYHAREVPPLGNLTVEGMVEDLGYLNEARKGIEKVEKILKERIKSQLDGKREVKSDNFSYKLEARPRTALNQERAKAYFEEQGILADYMDTTSVDTTIIKAL